MAGTAQAAEQIRCDRCTGHYVVDAASDGTPRVRCNECGHLREVAEPSPASIPGKWTVIGPDGKAMSFDTWEELTESRRPSAIKPTAKAMEEANNILKDLKPTAAQEKKSGSALLDITPAPKLALADMDSALDLGEAMGGTRKSRPGTTTTLTGSPGSTAPSGKLEPLLVRSFSQAPQTQSSKSVEWAPKIEKPDNTLRVELAPSHQIAPAGTTEKVIDADRPTAPTAMADKAPESLPELDSDSLLEDLSNDDDDEDNGAPLSLRDAIPDDELGDDEFDEEPPDPHDMLSLKDLVVAPPAKADARAKPATPSNAPKARSQPPPPTTKSVAPPPRPRSLSRPDVPSPSLPPPTIRPDVDNTDRTEDTARRRRVARTPEKQPNRTWMWALVGAVLLVGVWRLLQTPPEPPPNPKPVATIAPPTPVTTPAITNEPPTQPTTTDSITMEAPPTPTPTPTMTPTTTIGSNPPLTPDPNPTPTPTPTEKKPVANNTTHETPTPTPSATPSAKPGVATADNLGSMSDLLDRAGSAKRKGDFTTARELYGRVLAMSPNNVEANGGLGDVAKAQGDLAAAKTSYERALAASPTYSPALLGLADVEWDQGSQASARKRYALIVDRMGDRAPQRAKERAGGTQ